MRKLMITGGKSLSGTVKISGAKNAASKMIIASLLSQEEVIIDNIPLQQETDIARELVEMAGAETSVKDHTIRVRAKNISNNSAMALSRKNRLPILLAAPMLHRTGKAVIPKVGGDKIGPRSVDFHLNILKSMGVEVDVTEDGYSFKVSGKLQGTVVSLPYPSVGATETAIFAGVLASGKTTINNAAVEPEIVELIMMLQKMGAVIELGAGRRIEIVGVERLHGAEHKVLPDRMEAASYACIALATRGEIFCEGALHEDLVTFLNVVRLIGGEYEVRDDGILFSGARKYNSVHIETDTHPGFMTDWQQPFLVLLTLASGESSIHETVMQERFGYTSTLKKMGADIKLTKDCLGSLECRFNGSDYLHSAIINGPTELKATEMEIPDIRAGLAYVIAALVAEGTSQISGIEHLERGYEDLFGKLQAVGAQIKMID